MINEWLRSKLTQCVPGAKKLGLHKELVAIRARYNRHKRNWRPHLDETKRIIRAAVEDAPKDRSIMILGAGECLDIPLSTLGRHRAGAYLVDVVETLRTANAIRKYENIHYILHDVTGFIDESQGESRLPKINRRPGLVISCNMASQLYLPFANFPPQDDDDKTITRVILEDHITMLKRFPGPCLLISDYEKHIIDGEEESIYETIPLDLLGDPIDSWRWDICPKGELGPTLSAYLKVGVWIL